MILKQNYWSPRTEADQDQTGPGGTSGPVRYTLVYTYLRPVMYTHLYTHIRDLSCILVYTYSGPAMYSQILYQQRTV